jgi:hypothetical protein
MDRRKTAVINEYIKRRTCCHSVENVAKSVILVACCCMKNKTSEEPE